MKEMAVTKETEWVSDEGTNIIHSFIYGPPQGYLSFAPLMFVVLVSLELHCLIAHFIVTMLTIHS